jgi:hypothetical protein
MIFAFYSPYLLLCGLPTVFPLGQRSRANKSTAIPREVSESNLAL